MSELILLEAIELVPVIELEPATFSTREHPLPFGTFRDVPDEWNRYWLDSLADSGIVGLSPLRFASWLVPIRQLTSSSIMARILSILVREWRGAEVFSNSDSKPVLMGGLALRSHNRVLIAPSCCGDLGNLSEWKDTVVYRQPEWKTVWIGHPWISVYFKAGKLIFSEPHESDSPEARWMVNAEELDRAVAIAEAELEDFARRLEPVLDAMGIVEVQRNARRLSGLET